MSYSSKRLHLQVHCAQVKKMLSGCRDFGVVKRHFRPFQPGLINEVNIQQAMKEISFDTFFVV